MKTSVKILALAMAATVAGAAQAATITVEPDDHTGNMTNVAPGARLYTVRPNAANNGYDYLNVYSVTGGNWSPTGTKVFGHYLTLNGNHTQWEAFISPSSCIESCFGLFGVYFTMAAQSVKVLTTMRAHTIDPVELWAMDVDGNVLRKCRLLGADFASQTGVLPPPRIYGQPVFNGHAPTCGEVVEVKNCEGNSYYCDYVVEMRITRSQADIGFVWFGGQMVGNTHANVDKLTYSIPLIPLP